MGQAIVLLQDKLLQESEEFEMWLPKTENQAGGNQKDVHSCKTEEAQINTKQTEDAENKINKIQTQEWDLQENLDTEITRAALQDTRQNCQRRSSRRNFWNSQ